MRTTTIYYPDGRTLTRTWEDNTRPSYEWLKKAVEGCIESVSGYLNEEDGVEAWANEEGRILNLGLNVPGMKAINWPAPPAGWDSLTSGGSAGAPDEPVVLFAGMSEKEFDEARQKMARWQPVVGPILVMQGFSEETYDEDTHLTPDLGAEL